MKRIALIAAIATSLAAPATADVAFAINHFNQDKDSAAERQMVPSTEDRTTVSTRNASPLSMAFDEFNSVQDNAADLRGVQQATVIVGNHSDRANEIFAQMRAESLENQ